MIELAVHNEAGEKVGSVELDEARLGKRVRPNLLKQAIVMFQANRRQGTAANKSRGQVKGSLDCQVRPGNDSGIRDVRYDVGTRHQGPANDASAASQQA